jgi:Tfp pilus assembly protein PilX
MVREKMMNKNKMIAAAAGTNREGFAMVTTLLVVLILSVLAVGVAWLASSEKKTTSAEAVHMQSVYSADAGGEAAINFVRLSDTPPAILEFANFTVRNQGQTALDGTQAFSYRTSFVRKRLKPGWGVEFLDYDYRIASIGNASRSGESGVELVVSRLFKEGY